MSAASMSLYTIGTYPRLNFKNRWKKSMQHIGLINRRNHMTGNKVVNKSCVHICSRSLLSIFFLNRRYESAIATGFYNVAQWRCLYYYFALQ